MNIRIEDPDFTLDEHGRFPERGPLKATATSPAEFRQALVDWIKRETVGPDFGNYGLTEYLKIPPSQMYCAGILYPQQSPEVGLEVGVDQISNPGQEQAKEETFNLDPEHATTGRIRKPYNEFGENQADEELVLANSYRQAAIGLSFIVGPKTAVISVQVFASVYENVNVESVGGKAVDKEYEAVRYQRKPLDFAPVSIAINEKKPPRPENLNKSNLMLRCRVRLRQDGNKVVTVSIYNAHLAESDSGIQYRQCFYQCGLAITLSGGESFLPYDGLIQREITDPEELQLSLLYRDRKGYGLGHGCAVEWNSGTPHPNRLVTSVIPSYRVPPVVPQEAQGRECFSMQAYASDNGKTDEEVVSLLKKLPEGYESWIRGRQAEVGELGSTYTEPAQKNLDLCRETLRRIEAGITLVTKDSRAMLAFRLMNRAMVLQQVHYARKTRSVGDESWEELEPEGEEKLQPSQGWWRVFQLAFILSNLNGAHRSLDPKERDLVDLIWFPTGGGKTEAYLGLSAFSIFFRRLLNRNDAGCAVLMRYTLRLLTVQQFQRAAAMICACDQIRSNRRDLLGDESISIGMWVGGKLTPNTRQQAVRSLQDFFNPRRAGENKFQLLKCPWCGTSLSGNKRGSSGYRQLRSSVAFLCPESRCDYSIRTRRPLPVYVIDEDIYDKPPTLIIGTVDKFATMAWNEHSGRIFGRATPYSPPDLIIQDELHLISGPVGTMVGLYEGVIDLLCQDADGRGAKIVGSTATIRRAAAQCRALYNREVVQFPPPGISAADNFFSYEDPNDPGRVYLGICPLSASSFVTGIVRTFSAVLQGSARVPCSAENEEFIRDGYWTFVQYYNSLRELGRAVTLLQQDIPEWSESRAAAHNEVSRKVYFYDELTSRKTAEEIPTILEDLQRKWVKASLKGQKKAYDCILATNMISVGVDIDRLGVMAVLGQPKTTSEYIQASSRVGRKNHPGLVLACYNPAKPRDRSHFETFTRYHSSLYRWVEPTSVTPFSIPALDKGLHALLIIIARHLIGIERPASFSWQDQSLQRALGKIIERCEAIETNRPDRAKEVAEKLRAIADQWLDRTRDTWGRFDYEDDSLPLMVTYADKSRAPDAFVTPTSLRGVDDECEIQVSPPLDLSD
jgi:hypothetical protein